MTATRARVIVYQRRGLFDRLASRFMAAVRAAAVRQRRWLRQIFNEDLAWQFFFFIFFLAIAGFVVTACYFLMKAGFVGGVVFTIIFLSLYN